MRLQCSFLAGLTFFLSACGGAGLPRPSSQTPVILISIDTLRSDHLPAYGYRGIETPSIDAFRSDAILYQRAYSHCPLTLPSHATIFTGLLPAETEIRDNTGYELNTQAKTLAELLRAKGYATGAAVSTYVLRGQSGISRGFDFYEDEIGTGSPGIAISDVQRDGAETLKIARTWIEQNTGGPLLFFLHLYEPHSPYDPPEPYRSRYSNAYDGEIARSDEIVGEFLDSLKRLGLYDKSLIIFFSDHGEGLGDHGEDEHGIFVYREALQVPLLVKLPKSRYAGRTVVSPVQLSDIFPTVLEQTAASSVNSTGARSLLTFLKESPPPRPIYSETYFPRFHFGWSDLHSLIEGDYHYIRAPESELYDLASDAGETRNVLRERRRVVASMRRAMEPLVRAAEAPKALDPDEAAKFAALGYLGSAIPSDGPLPDPKSKTQTFRDIRESFKAFRAGRYEEALMSYQRLLEENPRMVDLWDVSARALMRLGRYEEAIEAAKKGLKVSPQLTHLALMIANLSFQVGRLQGAEQHAELALDMYPGEAHDILARVALARKDLERAEREARLALGHDRERARGLLTLARVEKERENYSAALAHVDEAVSILGSKRKSPLLNLHFLRGDILARMGRAAEAEEAFREEIRLFPEETQSYKNLILLLVSDGRVQEATRVIYELEKASPTPPAYAAISNTLRVVGDEKGARFWARRGLKRFPDNPALRKLAS